MKLVEQIKKFLDSLVNFAVDQNLPYLELRKAKLMNVIVFSITGILLIFLCINLVIENYFLAISDVVMIFIVSVPSLFLQYFRHYKANLLFITSAFFVFTTILTIVDYEYNRQTEHILIALSIMPIFLFDGWRKNLLFFCFPISFFSIRFIVMYDNTGSINLEVLHVIYFITFLIVYVIANYFKNDMLKFYAMLEESNRTKDKLFRIISHDIRNPFSSLLGSVELQKKYVELKNLEKLEKTSEIISLASNRIFDLTQTLLEWSQSQTDTFVARKESVNLNEIVQNVIELCEISSKPKGIDLLFVPTDSVVVYCDNVMSQIAIRNVIMNAIKFSYRDSKIDIEIIENGKSASILVRDYGVGMNAETLSNIFNENIIKSEFGTERERGSGLGLQICRELINKQAGEISVVSELGKGSVFKITLPFE